jgi:hypothetical protein
MEVVVPLFALSGLYLINKQSREERENFQNSQDLPNTNVPDVNYPDANNIQFPESEITAELSSLNKFNNEAGVYTDKFFDKGRYSDNNAAPGGDPEFYSLTGEKVNTQYFEHNNMTPYFGSKLNDQRRDDNTYESLLDSYTGSGSQDNSKREQAPLFEPDTNLQWANGTPNQSDFVQSRINPSLRKANVKPFEEERVAPGLGLGYTTEGGDGYNAGMMGRDSWKPKTVDELRVDSNPRASGVSLLGHEGPANSHIKQLGSIGKMEKNRPERAFELDNRQTGDDLGRLFVTGGGEKAQTLRSIPLESHSSRPETSTEYAGVANYQNSAAYVPGEYMPSHNQQLGAVPLGVASATRHNAAGENDFSVNAKKAYPNNRSANKQNDYFGAIGGSVKAAVAPLLDMLRPSRKENSVGTLRPYQNPGSSVPQSYVFNPNDKPSHTIRETTENSKFHMNVNANQHGGAYKVSQVQPTNTIRQETGDFMYVGGASAGDQTRKSTSYAAGYNQRNNDIKSSTIDGYMVKGNMSLLNSDVNMRERNRDDMLRNNRAVSGNMPYKAPSTDMLGMNSNVAKDLYSNIQMDRSNPEILNNLTSNPYVVDYRKGL